MGLLRRLSEEYGPLLADHDPTSAASRLALGAVLHSFYSGVESIMKRIARDAGCLPRGESLAGRPAVFDDPLYARLKPYLGFRHVFRTHYGFFIEWELMAPLVADYPTVSGDVVGALGRYADVLRTNLGDRK